LTKPGPGPAGASAEAGSSRPAGMAGCSLPERGRASGRASHARQGKKCRAVGLTFPLWEALCGLGRSPPRPDLPCPTPHDTCPRP
jgi:hypothetical protein